MPQVKYSNFQLYCLQICITYLKSHREALLYPFENVFCCKTTYFSWGLCNGYVIVGSVAVITGDRNKIDWRSEFVLLMLKMRCNSGHSSSVFCDSGGDDFVSHYFLYRHLGYFGVPLTLLRCTQNKNKPQKPTTQTPSTGFALQWSGISCSAPAEFSAATFVALPYICAIDGCLQWDIWYTNSS